MQKPNLYPFQAKSNLAAQLFRDYIHANWDAIVKEHGSTYFVGSSSPGANSVGEKRSWSYYEVDMDILSPTTVEFKAYGMESVVWGGRSTLIARFHEVYLGGELTQSIQHRMFEIAAAEEDRIAAHVAAVARHARVAVRMRTMFAVERSEMDMYPKEQKQESTEGNDK